MKPFLLLAVLLYTLLILGLWTVDGALLALGLPFAIYLAAGLLREPRELRLRVTRTLSADRVAHEAPVTVTLRIVN